MDSLLRLLMGPWTTYILWVLRSNGPTRFGELKRRVAGISAKMLTERLRMLEDAGVVFRNYQPTVPPQVTYGLTARGDELRQVLDGLSELAGRWQARDAEATQSPARGPARAPADGAAPVPLLAAPNDAGNGDGRSLSAAAARQRPDGAAAGRPLVPAE